MAAVHPSLLLRMRNDDERQRVHAEFMRRTAGRLNCICNYIAQ